MANQAERNGRHGRTLAMGPAGLLLLLMAALIMPGGILLADSGVPAEPPLPDIGDTCISGSVIDLYHQVAGGGWTVTIADDGGNTQSTTVDSDGEFKFEELSGGTWSLELEFPDGWRTHTPSSYQVTLSGEGDGCAQVRFKVEALPCLEVVKLDSEHALGKTPVGLPGWTIAISSGETSITEVTDGQGKATFYDLEPGVWLISEEPMVGWQPATAHGYERSLTLRSPKKPGVCEKVVFLNEQIHDGCIRVKKTDPVGLPLKGWRITITRDDGTRPSVTAYTDLSGYATFKGLALGGWTVTEGVRDSWRAVGATEQSVNLEVPGYCEPVSFSNEPLGCIDGYKINDLGQGLKDLEVTARNEDTGEEFTVKSDKTGYFQFKDLTLGIWTVSESLPQGWEPVTPPELMVDVKEPFVCEHIRFKNRTDFACVDVFKVDSYDGSGLPGWKIAIQPAYGGEPITGETDGVGWVRFNGLVPGTYEISETMQPAWLPDTPTMRKIMLVADGSCGVVTFKNHQKTAASRKGYHIYPTVHWGDAHSGTGYDGLSASDDGTTMMMMAPAIDDEDD